MDFPIYTTRDLYAVMYDDRNEAPSTYWLSNFFPGVYNSDKEEILFEKIGSSRKIAPFVLPTAQGKPTWRRRGSEVAMFKPAYIKPKDAVRPSEHFSRQPGDLFSLNPRTPLANFNAEVVRIMQFHRNIITRRWEWMAAQAIQHGRVVVASEDYPAVTVDFGRAAGHTITKSSGTYWTTDYDILGDIQSWMDTMAASPFGGLATRLTVGTSVWAIMRKNNPLKEEMDLTRRNTSVNIVTGLVQSTTAREQVKYVGSLGAGLDVYVYNDFYENDAGTAVPMMDPRDVILSAPNVDGVKAFGAIVDLKANLRSVDIFPKMWDQEDPSARFIMSQSAPLMIPVNPNCTLRARVLA